MPGARFESHAVLPMQFNLSVDFVVLIAKDGSTALLNAVCYDLPSLVDRLLALGADVDAANDVRRSPCIYPASMLTSLCCVNVEARRDSSDAVHIVRPACPD